MKSYQIYSNLANSWAKFAKNLEFFFLKSKNGLPKILLKLNILCTKILRTLKFYLKSKNFLKSNVLKSKIHCITWFFGWSMGKTIWSSDQNSTAICFFANIFWRIIFNSNRLIGFLIKKTHDFFVIWDKCHKKSLSRFLHL